MRKTSRAGRRSPSWARWLLTVGVVLMVLSGGSLVGANLVLSSATGAVDQENLIGGARSAADRKHADIKGAKNILLVGLDTRPSWKNKEPSRSDSIILLHLPADHSRAYLVSLPRDSYVEIPAYDNGKQPYRGGRNKINSAFAFGSRGLEGQEAEAHGFELLALTVKRLTGITPDAGAIIDFGGFKDVVNVLGKVCMYVDEDVTSIHIGHTADGKQAVPYKTDAAGLNPRKVPGVTANFYKKGNHCLTPVEALDFARQRDLLANRDSDYGRQRHQQQLLKAILKQAVHDGFNSPTKLPKLITAIGKTMTVDNGGISLEDWAFAMRNTNPDDLITIKTNDGKFNSESVPGIGSVEVLSDTTMELLRSVKDDTVPAFLQANPSWIADS
ncbi:LCP family protein [Couchioplanes caeruleus]|uniref:LCP family protein n=1 Tax=Couchioplanes caeruleus TaxID=56438 RepID=UPI0020C146AF|nr:LCP family protein [Couchioplanes caeruleus]UQU67864.1 LCP family protein [Couchioplanes caeruleus]